MILDEILKNAELKLRAEPAEGGARVSIFLPKQLAPLLPGLAGLALAAMAQSERKEWDDTIMKLSRQLANAFDGKHSDKEGNVLEAPDAAAPEEAGVTPAP